MNRTKNLSPLFHNRERWDGPSFFYLIFIFYFLCFIFFPAQHEVSTPAQENAKSIKKRVDPMSLCSYLANDDNLCRNETHDTTSYRPPSPPPLTPTLHTFMLSFVYTKKYTLAHTAGSDNGKTRRQHQTGNSNHRGIVQFERTVREGDLQAKHWRAS